MKLGSFSISLAVKDLDVSRLFYEKLGFQVMDSTEHGRELAGLIEEEHRIGINIANRVAMRMVL